MKRLRRYILFIAVIALAFFMIACNPPALSVPADIFVDEDNRLTWEAVPRARGYEIAIKNCDEGTVTIETSRRLFYSLTDLAEGDYEIRVRAKGNDKDHSSSDWSEIIYFEKEYETGCQYRLINGNTEFEIYRVGRAKGSFYIEDFYRGKPVTSIADAAFRGSGNVEEIVIGNNVRSIGNNAFYNCTSIKKIVLPDTVTYIGENAFQACRELTEVNIPNKLTRLYPYTFAYCRSLAKIELPESLTTIGSFAFYSCSELTELTIPDSVTSLGDNSFALCSGIEKVVLSKNIQAISENTFRSCLSLKEIDFSGTESLTMIGPSAFYGCENLTSVQLPDSVTLIDSRAFANCDKLNDIELSDNITEVGVYAFLNTVYHKTAVENEEKYVYVGDWLVGTTISSSSNDIQTLDETTLKEGVRGIANQVFMRCPELRVVTVPNSVRYIGRYAFYSCPNLWKVETLEGNKLELINYAAFSSCIIQNLSLSEGVKQIGGYAFYGNKQLASNEYLIPESVNSIGTYAFNDTYLFDHPDESGVVYAGNWIVGVADSTISTASCTYKGADGNDITARGIADYAFFECAALQNITGTGYVRYIGEGAFYGCSSLMAVSMNASIREIRPYTFYGCERLAQITLPVNLTTIGRSAFYGCAYLLNMDLSDTDVTTIEDYAFYKCSNLVSINFGRNVEKIGRRAFYGCSALDNVVIPDKVTVIDVRTFALCSSLKNLTIGANVEKIGNCAFWGCASLTTVVLPDSVRYIDDYAFASRPEDEANDGLGDTVVPDGDETSQLPPSRIHNIVFGKNVEHIGAYAFYGQNNIENLELPSSLKYIGEFAFKGLDRVKTLLIPGSVEFVDLHAFYGCKNLTVYMETDEIPETWVSRWNSSFRPVVLGCEFSEEGKYVVSVAVGENTLLNSNALGGLNLPEREGYVCIGWATANNADTAEYASLTEVPAGTTVYPVWTEKQE